ncbi:MAG: hypothetical protein RPT25_06595 [Cycloclasticus sp.]|jgi:hypothetical protein
MAQKINRDEIANTVCKLGLVANLMSLPGELVLSDDDKAGLVNMLYEVKEMLSVNVDAL